MKINMREIYDSIFKGAGLRTTNEANEMWAEFGYEVYKKYLAREIELANEVAQLKQDIKFFGSHLTTKDKKHLSKRLLDQIE
jgi:hypothetical protein